MARELMVKPIPSTFIENGTDPGNFGAFCSTTFRRFGTEVFMGLNLPKTTVCEIMPQRITEYPPNPYEGELKISSSELGS